MADGFLRPYHSKVSLFQRLLDTVLICVALWVAHGLYGVGIRNQNVVLLVLAVTLFYLFAEAKGIYGSWRIGGMIIEITDIVIAWGMVVAVLVMLAFMSKTSSDFFAPGRDNLVCHGACWHGYNAGVCQDISSRDASRGEEYQNAGYRRGKCTGSTFNRKITERAVDGHAAFGHLRRRGQ